MSWLDDPVLVCRQRPFTWRQILVWSLATEDGERFLADLRDGLSRQGQIDVQAECTSFRYQHRLLSSDDVRAWLGARDMSLDDWADALERRALRREEAPRGAVPTETAVASAVHAEGWTTGAYDRFRHTFSVAAALADGREVDPTSLREALARAPWLLPVDDGDLLVLAGIAEAAQQRIEANTRPERLAAIVDDHVLAWTAISYRALSHTDAHLMGEVSWGLRRDGRSLDQMARLAGLTVTEEVVVLEDAQHALRVRMAAAIPKQILGPVDLDGRWTVLTITDRQTPSLEHPDIARRAAERALNALVPGAHHG